MTPGFVLQVVAVLLLSTVSGVYTCIQVIGYRSDCRVMLTPTASTDLCAYKSKCFSIPLIHDAIDDNVQYAVAIV